MISAPFTRPTTIPIKSTISIQTYGLIVVSRISTASVIQLRETTAPTDRSIPLKPDKIVKVIPTVTIIKGALSINRFKNTCKEKKPVNVTDPIANNRTNKKAVT